MSSEPDALRLANKLAIMSEIDFDNVLRPAAAELRRLHAENEALRSTLAASCDEERQQLWEAISGGGCSRALEAEHRLQIATAELEADRAAMREALEALTRCVKGIDRLAEIARKWKPEVSFGADRQRIAQAEYAGNDARVAVEKLKARTG